MMNQNGKADPHWTPAAIAAIVEEFEVDCWLHDHASPLSEKPTAMSPHRKWAPIIVSPDCGDGAMAAALAHTITAKVNQICGDPGHAPDSGKQGAIAVGNEPDPKLNAAAQQCLDYVVNTDLEHTRFHEDAKFYVLAIPQDETPDTARRRLATGSGHEDATLLLSLPRDLLPELAADLIASYVCKAAGRMPGNDDRVMIVGHPASTGGLPNEAIEELKERLIASAPSEYQGVNEYGQAALSWVYYERATPTPPAGKAAWTRRHSHAELVAAAKREGSRNTPKYRSVQQGLTEANRVVRNLAPLTAGHTMMLIAAGQLDNVAITDPNGGSIVMKGNVRKESDWTSASGSSRRITTEKFVSDVQYMDLSTGKITHVDERMPGALPAFFAAHQAGIQNAVKESFPPQVEPASPEWEGIRQNMSRLIRNQQPVGKQTADAVTLAAHLTQHRLANLLGRPGTGKTFISLLTAAGLGVSRVIVVCPAHVITTWVEEITKTMPTARVRECRKVVDGKAAPPWAVPAGECDLKSAMDIGDATPERPLFVLIPQSAASLAGKTKLMTRHIGGERGPGLFRTLATRPWNVPKGTLPPVPTGRLHITTQAAETCPRCWGVLTGNRRFMKERSHRDQSCPHCGFRLRYPDLPNLVRGRTTLARSYPLLDYIARRRPQWADLVIVDEFHQYKARNSQRGDVIGRCVQKANKVLTLTGTYIGGMASDAYYLLQRTRGDFSQEFEWNQLGKFLQQYGRYRTVYERRDSGTQSRREIGGYHPMLLRFLMDNTVFTNMADLKRSLPDGDARRELPPPEFIPVLLPLADTPMPGDQISQQEWYQRLDQEVARGARRQFRNGEDPNYGLIKQMLITGPENCWKRESMLTPGAGKPVLPPLSAQALYPKEEAMIEIALQERDAGRRFMIYCTHTGNRSVVERTQAVLANAGLQVSYMDRDKVKAEQRLEWFRQQAAECDGIIVNPNSVSTGLNLTEFPTIIWQEISESAITNDQASCRSDRINQTQPVRVYYLAYRNTMQHDLLSMLAAKTDAGRSVYGELAKNGLSFMNPMADRFDDIIENELYRALEDTQTRGSDQVATETMALVNIRQDDAAISRMLSHGSIESESEVLMVINDAAWRDNLTVGYGVTGRGQPPATRAMPTTKRARPVQASFFD